jgi:ketosteroid isomerase-like protein
MPNSEHPNVTLLRHAHEALDRGDAEGFMALFDDKVRWYGTDLNGDSVIMTKEMMLRNTAEMVADLEESSSTPVGYEAVGDDLVVIKVKARRKAKGDEKAVEADFVTFYRLENGRVTLGGDVAPKVLEDFWRRYRLRRRRTEA